MIFTTSPIVFARITTKGPRNENTRTNLGTGGYRWQSLTITEMVSTLQCYSLEQLEPDSDEGNAHET